MAGRTYTVLELVGEIADAVEARLGGPVWVQGEVAELTRSRNGHVYFDLVERDGDGVALAAIPVVLWASVRDRVNVQLRRAGSIRIVDGVRIRITGRVELYEVRGRLQLQMQGIDPGYTLGLLATERERVLQLLEVEGLLHRNRQVPMPVAPLHLGLVTAGGSAAEADVLETLRESGLAWRVLHVDARVQGAGAAEEVAAALRTAAAAGVDVIALVRGGGARTDLATFDHELVARTIAALAVPVVTGIGHETDQSLADLVAHRAERTPTACAGALVAHVRASWDRAEDAWTSIRARADHTLATAATDAAHRARQAAQATTTLLAAEERRLDHARQRVRRGAPGALATAAGRLERAAGAVDATSRAHLRAHQHRLDVAAAALAAAAPRSLRHAERSLDGFAGRVEANDPRRALARGWSITRTPTGTVVRTTHDVEPGDTVITTVADGDFTAVVAPSAPDPLTPRTEIDPDAR